MVNDLTSCYFINAVFSIGHGDRSRDGVAHPEDRVALTQDLVLNSRTDRALQDLIIDRTVTTGFRTHDGNSIPIDRVRNKVVIGLAVRQGLLIAVAEIELYCGVRYIRYGQLQSMILSNLSAAFIDCIGKQTGDVVLFIVPIPNVRRIQNTDSINCSLLSDDA